MPRTATPLSETECRKAQAGEKSRFLIDGFGLFLELKPSGKKFWRFRYTFAGQRNILAISTYPEMSLAQAREEARRLNGLIDQGIEPQTQRRAAERAKGGADSFEAVAREWHEKFSGNWVPSHALKNLRRLESNIFPRIGKRPIGEVEAPELLDCIRRIEQRQILDTAHRTLALCGQVFRYAIATGRAKRDPSQDLRGAIPQAKEKHYSAFINPDDLRGFMLAADGYKGGQIVRAALALTPMLAVRPGELRKMEWSQVDLKTALWTFQASKTAQPHAVPLARQAVEILADLHVITGEGKYVFPNPRALDGSRPISENAVIVAMRNMGFSKTEVTPHGFRATFRTIGAEVLGFPENLLEQQLAHRVRDPLGRAYNRTTFLPERRAMMQRWADYLDELKGKV